MASILLVNKAAMDYTGGAETRIREVARRWAAHGHRVYMICAKTRCDEPIRSIEAGVTVRRIRVLPDWLLRRFPPPHYLPQALFYLVAVPHILYYIHRWRIEVIRDSMSPFPGLSFLAPMLGHRAVVVLHILFGGYRGWRRFYPAPYALMGSIAERMLLRGRLAYRSIVTDSPWLAEYIRQGAAHSTPVVAIENGVNFGMISTRAPRGRIARLVNAARFVEHKGQTELIEAARILREGGAAFELEIYGGGELARELEGLIRRYHLGSRVQLLPALPHAELLRRLSDFDLYVMPSRSEGLPVIMLEAMAARLPVVIAARPYATSLVAPGTVLTYEPGNARSLADVIAGAFANPEATEAMAGRAFEWVRQFTWDRAARLELQVLMDHRSDDRAAPGRNRVR